MVNSCPLWYPFSIGMSSLSFNWTLYRVGYADSFFHHFRDTTSRIYWVGAIDWDRRLFDALIPLPDGTSYNSYLVMGSEKTALIDTVDTAMPEVLLNHLSELGIENIDYVVANHAEQDHSGAIPHVLEKYPRRKWYAHPSVRICSWACC